MNYSYRSIDKKELVEAIILWIFLYCLAGICLYIGWFGDSQSQSDQYVCLTLGIALAIVSILSMIMALSCTIIYTIVIDQHGIKLKGLAKTIRFCSWEEIKVIYCYEFSDSDPKKKRGIFSKKAPVFSKYSSSKWFYIMENIEHPYDHRISDLAMYQTPNRYDRPIRLQYRQDALMAISQHYPKEIIKRDVNLL